MSLVGECEVPAHRCGPVIQTVLQQIGGARVQETDLPSQRSALRFVDQGHVISKAHVAEALVQGDYWDLHIDGTTRNGVKAAVMKSFQKNLEEERRILLHTDEGLDFLHCNAHFLLGLGAECKKVLGQEEKDRGEQLGRDNLSRFSSYSKNTECSAFRYIRMVCDCCGPRGDDQHGCRDSWLAYCLMVGRKSAVTSFRENRFNNLFQAAASIHFHRQDIQDCISNFLPKVNKKIDSILADNGSKVIDCHVITLGSQVRQEENKYIKTQTVLRGMEEGH
ncbi:hypothetical protein ACOMHN_017530 [Nucella lapillus]